MLVFARKLKKSSHLMNGKTFIFKENNSDNDAVGVMLADTGEADSVE
jgi:hypothetical protein